LPGARNFGEKILSLNEKRRFGFNVKKIETLSGRENSLCKDAENRVKTPFVLRVIS
jgi:hypothetical protein